MKKFLFGGISIVSLFVTNIAMAADGYVCDEVVNYQTCAKGRYRYDTGKEYGADREHIYGCMPCPEDYVDAEDAQSESECALITSAGKFVYNEKEGQIDCMDPYYCPGGVTVTYGDTGGNESCLNFLLDKLLEHFGTADADSFDDTMWIAAESGATSVSQCSLEFKGGDRIVYNEQAGEFGMDSCADGTARASGTYGFDEVIGRLDEFSSCSGCGVGQISNSTHTQCIECPYNEMLGSRTDLAGKYSSIDQTDLGLTACAVKMDTFDIEYGTVIKLECGYSYEDKKFLCSNDKGQMPFMCDDKYVLDSFSSSYAPSKNVYKYDESTDLGQLVVNRIDALKCKVAAPGYFSPEGSVVGILCKPKTVDGVSAGGYCVGGEWKTCPRAENVIGDAVVYGITDPENGASSIGQCYLPADPDIIYNDPGVGTYNIVDVCHHKEDSFDETIATEEEKAARCQDLGGDVNWEENPADETLFYAGCLHSGDFPATESDCNELTNLGNDVFWEDGTCTYMCGMGNLEIDLMSGKAVCP